MKSCSADAKFEGVTVLTVLSYSTGVRSNKWTASM